ncbi:sodium:proton antiporter [Enterovirga sp. CN4-39]|uniref:sodium:proton antiporter n=1 Tax=Enterovirga sp. CN4-39 TaxID=3400910 RepID=UPI003C0CCED7
MRVGLGLAAAAAAGFWAGPAQAAGAIDGKALGLVWAIPFVGILLSIAILPQLAHRFWDRHMGALSAFWALLVLVPLGLTQGFAPTLDVVMHVLLTEYMPFILLLFALFTIAGGLVVVGNLHGSPALNTGLLAFGTVLASCIGTTGASMVLIRPLLRANDNRVHNVHVVVFFIFLVSNVGGALTPLGDPPLFLGFLRGVDFFWTTRFLAAETLFTAGVLLAIFFVLDTYWYRREGVTVPDPTPDDERLHIRGVVNLVLLAALVGVIVLSGVWRPGISLHVLHVELQLQNLVRDAAMVILALLSLALTSKRNRAANDFNWRPIIEVAKIFAGIFVCLVPVAAALGAGREGAFAPLLALVSRPDGSPNEVAYFWLTGILSSFLDNAPTYLVFFELAGGDPVQLMGPLAGTLAAISTGAVFMGANSYIGNAPNFMVYAIARDGGVKMPSFFGYMLWSGAILVPIFVVVTFIFFR